MYGLWNEGSQSRLNVGEFPYSPFILNALAVRLLCFCCLHLGARMASLGERTEGTVMFFSLSYISSFKIST